MDILSSTSDFPKIKLCHFISFSMTQQPPVGQRLLIIEASRSHSDTTGFLWTSDQFDAEAST
jgi:hypothetical protein